MADDIRPPSMDDDNDPDFGAFNDFVNDHLDLSDLESSNAQPRPRPANFFGSSNTPPTPPLPGLHRIDSDDIDQSLFDDDDDDNEDIGLQSRLPGFGTRPSTPSSSQFWRRSSSANPESTPSDPSGRRLPFGTGVPSASNLPPRIPFPPSTDSRWSAGVYSVRDDLEIFSPPSLFSLSRVTVVANASRRVDKRIEFIRDIAPGWSAVRLTLHPGRMPITGYVRSGSVRLMNASHLRRNLFELLDLRVTLIDALVLVAAILLISAVVSQVLSTQELPADSGRENDRVTSLEAELQAQSERISQLEAMMNSQLR